MYLLFIRESYLPLKDIFRTRFMVYFLRRRLKERADDVRNECKPDVCSEASAVSLTWRDKSAALLNDCDNDLARVTTGGGGRCSRGETIRRPEPVGRSLLRDSVELRRVRCSFADDCRRPLKRE